MPSALDILHRLMPLLTAKDMVRVVQAPPFGNLTQIEMHWEKLWEAMDEAKEFVKRDVAEGADSGDEFGYFELGRSFYEEFTRLALDGNFKGFICGCSPIEILVHLINERDEAQATPPKPAPDAMREAIELTLGKIAREKSGLYLSPICISTMADAILALLPPSGTGAAEPVAGDTLHALELAHSLLPNGPARDRIFLASISLKRALSLPVQPGAGERLSQAAEWCRVEREKIGAVDGYDYRSGKEFGLRRAQIELERLSRQPQQSSREG